MKAVCFACGHEKRLPLVLCDRCEVKPISHKDKITSVCLSDYCLKSESLLKASHYIREKGTLPTFHQKCVTKATDFVDSLPTDDEEYTTMGVDDSFFDFQGFKDKKGETVKVHAIGKPAKENVQQATGISHLGTQKNTYQVLEWQVGKEISIDDADMHVDDQGELYIEYTWVADKGWIWKHVSKGHFRQLKMLDEMRG